MSNMVPETGLEPVQEVIPRDFKSLASTNSATPAEKIEENGGTFRIRTGDGDFADLCLTSWLRCRPKRISIEKGHKKMERETGFGPATSTLAR